MKHHKILILSFIVLVLGNSALVEADETVTIHSPWKIGDTLAYTSTLKQGQAAFGDTTYQAFIRFAIELVVVGEQDDNYVIDITYAMDSIYSPEKTLEEAMSAMDGLAYTYYASKEGEFVKLHDWTVVRDYLHTNLDALAAKFNVPQIVVFFDQMKTLYATEESVQKNAINDVTTFHKYYNKPMIIGEVTESEVMVPSPFGGEDIKTTQTSELIKTPASGSFYEIHEKHIMDHERLVDLVYDVVAQMMPSEEIDSTMFKGILANVKNETLMNIRFRENGLLDQVIVRTVFSTYMMTQINTNILEFQEYKPAQ